MKRFSFRLQKVLNLREHHENEAKIELGRAIGVLAELENNLFTLGQEQAKAAGEQFSSGNSTFLMQQYMFYLMRLENAKEQLLVKAAEAELKVEEAREVFIEASRERKALDKLKEKRQKEYRKYVLAEETKAMDDGHGRQVHMD